MSLRISTQGLPSQGVPDSGRQCQVGRSQFVKAVDPGPGLDVGQLAGRLKALYAGQQQIIGRHSLLEEAETVAAVDQVFFRTAEHFASIDSDTGYFRIANQVSEDLFEDSFESGDDGYADYGGSGDFDEESAQLVGISKAEIETKELQGKGLSVLRLDQASVVFLKEKLGPRAKGGAFKRMKLALKVDKLFTSAQVVASATMTPPKALELRVLFENEVQMNRLIQKLGQLPGVVGVHSVLVYTSKKGEDKVGIVMDLGRGGSLGGRMAQMSTSEVMCAVRGGLIGLQNLHEHGILHLDPKPDNLFLDENGEGLLGDFGCAVELDAVGRGHYMAGDRVYRAPELVSLYKERHEQLLHFPRYALVHERVKEAYDWVQKAEEMIESCMMRLVLCADEDRVQCEAELQSAQVRLAAAEQFFQISKAERKSIRNALLPNLTDKAMQIDRSFERAEVYGWALTLEEALKASIAPGTKGSALAEVPYPDDVPAQVRQLIQMAKSTDPAIRPKLAEFIAALA